MRTTYSGLHILIVVHISEHSVDLVISAGNWIWTIVDSESKVNATITNEAMKSQHSQNNKHHTKHWNKRETKNCHRDHLFLLNLWYSTLLLILLASAEMQNYCCSLCITWITHTQFPSPVNARTANIIPNALENQNRSTKPKFKWTPFVNQIWATTALPAPVDLLLRKPSLTTYDHGLNQNIAREAQLTALFNEILNPRWWTSYTTNEHCLKPWSQTFPHINDNGLLYPHQQALQLVTKTKSAASLTADDHCLKP